MAEARSATTEPPIIYEEYEEPDTFVTIVCSWWRIFLRIFYQTRNSIRNGMWPTSLYNLIVISFFAYILIFFEWMSFRWFTDYIWLFENPRSFYNGASLHLRTFISSLSFGLVFFIVLMIIRRYLLRLLLSYQGWIFEPPKRQSIQTSIWALVVRLVSGYNPSLYSYQSGLPRVSVPPLRATLKGLIKSLEPLYGPDSKQVRDLCQQSKEFEKMLGRKLQHILVAKSWITQNYVNDWWEKYVYLMNRGPLFNNSNYYILDHSYVKFTDSPTARAAVICYWMLQAKRLLSKEEWAPIVIRNTIPLCMAQYERVFNTCRVPGEDCDQLVHHSGGYNHIVVFRKGHFYKLDLTDKRKQPIQPDILQTMFEWICTDSDNQTCEEPHLCALTALNRTEWAKLRTEHFLCPENRSLIEAIETALFFLTLDVQASVQTLTERGKNSLHGDGANMWADKSFNLIIFQNAKLSVNAEHSWADAPVLGHILEFVMSKEVFYTSRCYNEEGNALCQLRGTCFSPHSRLGRTRKPERLVWQCSERLRARIGAAKSTACSLNADIDLRVHDFTSFGKGYIKTCQVSPDAFVQIALQLAYYRESGQFALTYESSMMRLFNCGRTETVRSLSQEMVDFVLAMSSTVNRGLKKRLFVRASEEHTLRYKQAMVGLGIDRHLFALYVAARAFGYDSDFLKTVLTLPWTLSTSQQPQTQMPNMPSADLPQYKNVVSPGGGFGPVSDEGYGVAYMVVGDFRIFFHVSSKFSCSKTSSDRFLQGICQALLDIKLLFDSPDDD